MIGHIQALTPTCIYALIQTRSSYKEIGNRDYLLLFKAGALKIPNPVHQWSASASPQAKSGLPAIISGLPDSFESAWY